MSLNVATMSREELEQRFQERGDLIDSLVAQSVEAWAALGYGGSSHVSYSLSEAIRLKLEGRSEPNAAASSR